MAEKVKIKTEYGTISASPAQAEAWKAREERNKVQQERIAAVRENARAMSRYRQEKEIAKGQRSAREERAKGGYDATPTGRFGQPVESFWTAESPQMPEMRPVPQPIPQFPDTTQLAGKMMFGEGRLYDAMRAPYTYESKYEIPYFENRQSAYGPYAQNPAPSFSEFGGFSNEEYARGIAEGGLRNYNPDYGLPYPFNVRVGAFDNDYFLESKALGRVTFGRKLPFYLASNPTPYPYKY